MKSEVKAVFDREVRPILERLPYHEQWERAGELGPELFQCFLDWTFSDEELRKAQIAQALRAGNPELARQIAEDRGQSVIHE